MGVLFFLTSPLHFPFDFLQKRHTKTKTLLSNLKSENPTLFLLYPSWLSITMHIQFPFLSKFDYSLSPTLPIPSQSQPHNTLHTTHLCKQIVWVHIIELVYELNQKLEEKGQAWESQTPPPLLSKWLFYYRPNFFIDAPTSTTTVVSTNVVTSKKPTTITITFKSSKPEQTKPITRWVERERVVVKEREKGAGGSSIPYNCYYFFFINKQIHLVPQKWWENQRNLYPN